MITGDFAELARLIERVGTLQAAALDGAQRSAAVLGAEVQQGFDDGVDPYGNPWVEVKPATLARRKQKKTPPPLTDTREMRDSMQARASGLEVSIEVTKPSAPAAPQALQRRRPMLPVDALPARWGDLVSRECGNALTRHLEGSR